MESSAPESPPESSLGSSLLAGPSSSAAHGVTYGQNVAQDVAERIAAIHRRTRLYFGIGVATLAGFAALTAAPTSSIARATCRG